MAYFSCLRLYDASQDVEITDYGYSGDGKSLASVTDALGNVTTYAYPTSNNRGLPTTMITPRGNLTTGDPNDYKTQYEYNDTGQTTLRRQRLEDNKWITDSYTYDAVGNLKSAKSGYYTDNNGTLSGQDGNITTYDYDLLGRVIRTTLPDPDGSGGLPSPATENTYDAAGNLIKVEDKTVSSDVRMVDYIYDHMHRRVATVSPDGTIRQSAYDAIGNATRQIDELGRATQNVYDSRNRPIQTILADGNVTSRLYDGGGRRGRRHRRP